VCSVCVVKSSAELLAMSSGCPIEIGSSKRTPGVAGDGCGPNNETRTFSLPSLKYKRKMRFVGRLFITMTISTDGVALDEIVGPTN